MGVVPIVAAEGVTGMISSALENVSTVFNSAVTMITGNEVAMVFIGIALVGGGIGLFHRLIRH